MKAQSRCEMTFRGILVRIASPRRFLQTNKQNESFIKELSKNIRYSCFRRVHIKFLYNSKFDLTAKSLVTNTVVITRVLCILTGSHIFASVSGILADC